MASLKFYLKRPNAKTETAIYFLLNYGSYEIVSGVKKHLPLKYYTNESIEPKFWNAKTGRVKEIKDFPQHPEFNTRLRDIESKALNILRRLQNDEITPTKEILKDEFGKIWKDTKDLTNTDVSGYSFVQFIRHFIETSTCEKSTIHSYRMTLKNIEDYEKLYKVKLSFKKIDIDFYNKFVKMCNEKMYSPNTTGTRIKNIKRFMRAADDAGIEISTDYQKKTFAKPNELIESIYLSLVELERIYNLNLSKNKPLDEARDMFLIGCYTGLRFSDISKLNKNNLTYENTIVIRTTKTKSVIEVPVHTVVRSIFEKYDYKLPKVVSNTLFNERIREICQKAQITEQITHEITKGKMRVNQTEPKYNLVSSHTARRSFATNSYLEDIPAISIMKITGHRTESSFMKYIKISGKDNARKLMHHKFFTKMVVNK